jgi:hypothetical protein
MKHLTRQALISSTAIVLALALGSGAAAEAKPSTTATGITGTAAGESPAAPAKGQDVATTTRTLQANAALGPYHLKFGHSGKCLNLPNASTADNVWMEQWTCGNVTTELWYFDTNSDGTMFKIRSASSNKCLNFQGAVYTNGTRIIQSGCGTYAHGWFELEYTYDANNNLYPPGEWWWIQGAYAPGWSGCLHQQGAVATNGGKATSWQCAIGYTNMWIDLY